MTIHAYAVCWFNVDCSVSSLSGDSFNRCACCACAVTLLNPRVPLLSWPLADLDFDVDLDFDFDFDFDVDLDFDFDFDLDFDVDF
jgi:hypothetical protein